MKKALTICLIFATTLVFSQGLETGKLWRTKGVYDKDGSFVERDKTEKFLFVEAPDKAYVLTTEEWMHMKTGDIKLMVFRDTLNLDSINEGVYESRTRRDTSILTVHKPDSVTLKREDKAVVFVKLNVEKPNIELKKFTTTLMKSSQLSTVEGVEGNKMTYKKDGFVRIEPLESKSAWDSGYKIIEFNGFIIIKGVMSAPKLITELDKKRIGFIEIDYRFENKNGEYIKTK